MDQFTLPCPDCDSLYQVKSDNNLICGDCGKFLTEIYHPFESDLSRFNISEILQTLKLNSWGNFPAKYPR